MSRANFVGIDMKDLKEIDYPGLVQRVTKQYTNVWSSLSIIDDSVSEPEAIPVIFYRSSDCHLRKQVTFLQCSKKEPVFPDIPRYFGRAASCDAKCIARFVVGTHNLEVERGRFASVPWSERRCPRCRSEYLDTLSCPVDDEHHFMFECEAFAHLS